MRCGIGLAIRIMFFRVVVKAFQFDIDNKNSLYISSLGDTGQRLRSNEVDNFHSGNIRIESVALCLFQLKLFIKLSLRHRAVDFC